MLLRNKSALGMVLLLASTLAHATVPDWVSNAAKTAVSISAYDDETTAVVLLDDEIATVQGNGDVVIHYRRVVKVLRPQGHAEALLEVPFDKDEKILSLAAYTITAKGLELEAREKDSFERSAGEGDLYQDTKYKTISAPEGEAGDVVAFEFSQRQRPYLLEQVWRFQEREPVLLARFTLNLPSGWEYAEKWLNYADAKPVSQSGQQTVWEVRDVARIKREHRMPSWKAVAGRMSVHFFGPGMQSRSNRTWTEFGAWYGALAADRRTATPAMTATVNQLTASAPDFASKVQAIASWMQHQVRYVSIQIGIGGYQPHPAGDIFRNRYGDCKDKATLMSTMLKQAGIDSEYVVVNLFDRDAVMPNVPSSGYFNHVILAIRLPGDEYKGAPAVFKDKAGQRWLLFDPTDEHLAVGYIEGSMQGSYGLFVNGGRGELVRFPTVDPAKNYFNTNGTLKLEADSTLSGEITLACSGDAADEFRSAIHALPPNEMQKGLEHFMNDAFVGASIDDVKVENLDRYDQELRVRYTFKASSYAKNAGPLLLVRPRVIGQYWYGLDAKERKYPYEFDYVEGRKDDFSITLPPGYKLDELPNPVHTDVGFATYTAKAEMKDNVLHYTRSMEIKDPDVPLDHIMDLRRLFHSIALDEKGSAIFKKAD